VDFDHVDDDRPEGEKEAGAAAAAHHGQSGTRESWGKCPPALVRIRREECLATTIGVNMV
jgi:hypothetical protein